MYSQVDELYITYIHSFLGLFPCRPLQMYWVEFLVLFSRSLLVICFMYHNVYMSIPIFSVYPPFPAGNHKFILYICNSVLWRSVHTLITGILDKTFSHLGLDCLECRLLSHQECCQQTVVDVDFAYYSEFARCLLCAPKQGWEQWKRPFTTL